MIFSILLFGVVIVPAGQSFACTPVAVYDGDGPIWCDEGPRVRLAGIAAREIDNSCRTGHPCPKASGLAARDALANLVGTPTGRLRTGHITTTGPTMRCVSVGGAKGTRTGAWCVSPKSGDLSCAMVSKGFAAVWDRYWNGHRC